MNQRICLECEHCYVDAGHHGYSEYTPSSPFNFYCTKNHRFKTIPLGHEGDKSTLLDDIKKAGNCRDFEKTKQ